MVQEEKPALEFKTSLVLFGQGAYARALERSV